MNSSFLLKAINNNDNNNNNNSSASKKLNFFVEVHHLVGCNTQFLKTC